MKYLFKYNDNNINVFVSDTENGTKVIAKLNDKIYEPIIEEDKNGKYFDFREKKIYLKELEPITLEYLLRRMRRGKIISPMEMDQALEKVRCIDAKCEFGNTGYVKILYLGYDEIEKNYQYKIEGNLLGVEDGISMVGQTIKDYTLAYMLNTGMLKIA